MTKYHPLQKKKNLIMSTSCYAIVLYIMCNATETITVHLMIEGKILII